MKIVPPNRTFSIFIIVLFILIICALFVMVNNETGFKAGAKVLPDSLLLLLLAAGLILYVMAKARQKHEIDGSGNSVMPASMDRDEKQTQDTKEAELAEEEKMMDVERIIPQNDQVFSTYAEKLLQNMADEFKIVQGLLYFIQDGSEIYTSRAKYAYYSDQQPANVKYGETLSGQAIKNRKTVSLENIPENYFTVASGLGKGIPKEIVFVPIINEGNAIGLIEYATFSTFNGTIEKQLDLIAREVAGTLVNLSKK